MRGRILSSMNNALTSLLGKNTAYRFMRPFWDMASASFVRASNGVVHIFLNAAGISDTSVFYRIEWQILRETGQRVVWHFVR